MFAKLETQSRRRRIVSPTTIAASVGAHVLLVGGVLVASSGDPRPLPPPDEPHLTWIEPVPPRVEPQPAAPERLRPAELPRVPVPRGEAVVMPNPPQEIPTRLPEYSPSDRPIRPADVDGIHLAGDPDGDPGVRPAPGVPVGPAGGGEGDAPVYRPSAVEERPALRNTAEMQRVLQRLYPALLREAGIAGQTRLEFVVDAEGRVEPGSVTVVSTTHESFAAPSLEAAEKFRFRPAKIRGRPVRVVISMPISWQLEQD